MNTQEKWVNEIPLNISKNFIEIAFGLAVFKS